MPSGVKELAEIVSTAKQATEELVDTDLRQVAFERVLDHLLKNGGTSSSVEAAAAVQVPASNVQATSNADGAFAEEQQRIDAIASYFKISPEDVQHIFDVSGEQPKLSMHSNSLAVSRSEAAREIALLIAGAHTALGRETTTAHIRSAACDYNKLDPPNFMKTLGKMPEASVLGKPGSPNRVIRMKVSGVEKAQELAQRLTGE